MEDCNYQVVSTNDRNSALDNSDSTPWKYFFRQVVLSSAIWTLYFTAGLCVGMPTVLVPQLKKEMNSTDISDEMVSWLYSGYGVGATLWVLIVPTFSTCVGRKLPYLISSASMLAAFAILYFSNEPYHILISESVQGFTHASNITITVLIVTEYSDPKYRGVFLTIKSASFFWGIWAANAIGTFFHWRYIAVAGILCSLFTFIGAPYPESPHWLASKGKYDQCKSSFRWLRGSNDKSEKELKDIIDSHINHRKHINESSEISTKWEHFKQICIDRKFYLPLGLSVLTSLQYIFSGKIICNTYAVDIIKSMTGSEAAAYTGMLILDGITVIGMYVGSFVSKVLKRRTLYMSSSFTGITFLFVLALYLYLIKLSVIGESKTISILLLTIYSVSISCGPMIMSMTITGELIPTKYQALCYSIHATLFSILFFLTVKFAPLIFIALEMHGTFFLLGLTAGACTVILYLYLPETKDKTLLEIEEYFKGRKDDVDEQI